MKIMHFCMHAPFTEHYSYQDNLLTEYQHKHGDDVRIVTGTRTRDENGRVIQVAPGSKTLDNGVELVRLALPGKWRQLLGVYSGLMQQMRAYQPDLIFIHGLCSFIPATAIRYKQRYAPQVRIVADNHQDEGTTNVNGFPFSHVMSLHRRKWKQWIPYVDRVFGTTGWRVTFAHRFYGIPQDKLEVLIMGIDSDRLPAEHAPVRAALREQLGIGEDCFVFVTGGKLDSRKRFAQSVNAFSRLAGEHLRFVIFGSVAPELQQMFDRALQEDKRIIYCGYIPSDEVWRYFFAADCGVFPGRHSVLWEEAIGCSLPCIFRRYEPHDHTEVCGNCVCLSQTEESDIYAAMSRMAQDAPYYAAMRKAAEQAAPSFSYHSIARQSVACVKGAQP